MSGWKNKEVTILSSKKKSRVKSRGQVLVEYVLLMVISVACATLLMRALVGRGDDSSRGILIRQWDNIIKKIGNDMPTCPNQTDFNNPSCPP